MPTVERFIALFDILGFKSLLSSSGIKRVESALRLFQLQIHISTAEPRANFAPIVDYRIFSDTVFAFTPDAQIESFSALTRFSRDLISAAFNTGIKLRGAVVRGPVVIDEQLYIGEPIVRAYLMEQSQEWVGCWVDDSCFESIDPNSQLFKQTILRYPIPQKGNKTVEGWVIRWGDRLSPDVSASEAAVASVFFAGSARTPETITQTAGKLANTIKFIRTCARHTFSPPEK